MQPTNPVIVSPLTSGNLLNADLTCRSPFPEPILKMFIDFLSGSEALKLSHLKITKNKDTLNFLWTIIFLRHYPEAAEVINADLNNRNLMDFSIRRIQANLFSAMRELPFEPCENLVQKTEVTCLSSFFKSGFLSGSATGVISIWNKEGKITRTRVKHTKKITCFAVHNTLGFASGSEDNSIRLWVKNGDEIKKEILTKDIVDFAVKCLIYLPNQRLASGGSSEGNIYLWSLSGSDQPQILKKHTNTVNCFTLLRGMLVSGSDDATINIWSKNFEAYKTLHGHSQRVTSLASLPCGNFASGSEDRTIRLWDLNGHPVKVIRLSIPGEVTLTILKDQRLAACVNHYYQTESIFIFTQDGERSTTVSLEKAGVRHITSLSSGQIIFGSSMSGICNEIFRLNIPKPQSIVKKAICDATSRIDCVHENNTAEINCLIKLNNEEWISGSPHGQLHLWKKGIVCAEIIGHTDPVLCLASLTLPVKEKETVLRHVLASGSRDGEIRVWENNFSKSIIFSPINSPSPVSSLIMLAKRVLVEKTVIHRYEIVAGYVNGHIRIWNECGSVRHDLKKHKNAVTCLANLPDGGFVSGSEDCTVRVWDSNGTNIDILEGHRTSIIYLVVISGKIISRSSDAIFITDINDKSWNKMDFDCAISRLIVNSDRLIAVGTIDNKMHLINDDWTIAQSFSYDNINNDLFRGGWLLSGSNQAVRFF